MEHINTLKTQLNTVQDMIFSLEQKYTKVGEQRLRKATTELGKQLKEFREASVAATK
jgi:hypothetical protein